MPGHRFNPEHAHKLDNPERRKVLPPEQILQELGISSGDCVLDLGAGTGYFSIPAAGMTGETVYALDVEPRMLDILKEKMKQQNISNIDLIQGEMENIPLEAQCVDKVIASLILHETGDLSRVLNEMKRVMKKGSNALIIDWEKKEMEQGPPYHERIDKEELIPVLSSEGFHVTASRSIHDQFYMIQVEKQ
ncbi:MAG: class I SAM-dependent methyltransferase [Bacillaceae bacterium]|nr:class I SAM-dependent methyltransferase [Bacillaceae bacterium]